MAQWPDPLLNHFCLTVVFPYLLERRGDDEEDARRFSEALFSPSFRPPEGWEGRGPKELAKRNLGRWFFREVRTLVLEDEGSGVSSAAKGDPRFRWLRFIKPLDAAEPDGWRVGAATGDGQGGAVVSLYPPGVEMEAFALLGEIGTCMLALRLTANREIGLQLSQAMSLAYFASHSGGTSHGLVLIPESLISPPLSEGTIRFGPEQLKECRALTPSGHLPKTGLPLMEALVPRFRDEVLTPVGCPPTYLATRTKTPMMVNILLPGQSAAERVSRDLEWVMTRFLRHPTDSAVVAPQSWDRSEQQIIRSVEVTGSQVLRVTSEGVLALGYADTPFDVLWPNYLAHEYLFTWLISVHQSVVVHDISWQSAARTRKDDPTETNELLLQRFMEFDTIYEFGRISHQATIQALYDASREALGVKEAVEEVRQELTMWIDARGHREQRALNSLAIVVILTSMATVLVSLNVTWFNQDAVVDPMSTNALALWVPMMMVLLLMLNRHVRQHLLRAIEYLLKG